MVLCQAYENRLIREFLASQAAVPPLYSKLAAFAVEILACPILELMAEDLDVRVDGRELKKEVSEPCVPAIEAPKLSRGVFRERRGGLDDLLESDLKQFGWWRL